MCTETPSAHELMCLADSLTIGVNYTISELRYQSGLVIGVDTDDLISLLLTHELIRPVTRYVNGKYKTVYTRVR